ncbi:MAG: tetratricopeptide repeat protein, partial [Candidatus Gracilibacteria bacterium]
MNANYFLGKSYLEAMDADRAIDNFSKIIESNSSDAATLKVDTYISLAQAYYQKGEYQNSLNCYKKANEIAPGTDLKNLDLYTDVYDVNNQIKS